MTKVTSRGPAARRPTFVLGAGLLAALALGIALWWYFGRIPPQMGSDAAVFRTVDALYTAVRMRDTTRIAECEKRLVAYREAGSLSPDGFAYLASIMRQARSESWEPAVKSLYRFMLVQRRADAIGENP